MTRKEAVNWLINLSADIGKAEHRSLWHYEQALSEIKELLESEPQEKPEWIPCSERLPEEDVEVLVTDDAGGMATIEKDMCGTYENTGERFWYTSQNVTAWMPLPEPYNGRGKE